MPFCGLLPPRRPPSPLPLMPRRSPFRKKLQKSPQFPSQFAPSVVDCRSEETRGTSIHDSKPVPFEIDETPNHETQLAGSSEDGNCFADSVDECIDPTAAMVQSASSKSNEPTMLHVAAAAAFLVASQGAFLVGKVALGSATMTVAMACSVLQVIRSARETTSAKVALLPPTLQIPNSLASSTICATDAVETFPQSPKIPRPIATNQASDSPLSSPRPASPRCLDSPVSSPDSSKKISFFKIKLGPKDPRHRQPPGSTSPIHQVSRMVDDLTEEKSPVKSCRFQQTNIPRFQQIQQKSFNLESALAIVGLLIGLIGLSSGLLYSILSVVCWWYAIPYIKQMVGDKPTVARVHLGGDLRKTDHKNDKGNGSSTCKIELRPGDYRKRLIMEGILERDRRPIAG